MNFALSPGLFAVCVIFMIVSSWLTVRRKYATSAVVDALAGTTAIVGAFYGMIASANFVETPSLMVVGIAFNTVMVTFGVFFILLAIKRAALEDRAKEIDQAIIAAHKDTAPTVSEG